MQPNAGAASLPAPAKLSVPAASEILKLAAAQALDKLEDIGNSAAMEPIASFAIFAFACMCMCMSMRVAVRAAAVRKPR